MKYDSRIPEIVDYEADDYDPYKIRGRSRKGKNENKNKAILMTESQFLSPQYQQKKQQQTQQEE